MRKSVMLATSALMFLSHALPAMAEAKLGEAAPDFSLPDADGKTVNLSDFKGKKVVVVYFYPKDETPVCTTEACTFRDKYEALKTAGAEVIGISSDSADTHKKFAEHRKLPFILLSDDGGKVRKDWGVKGALGRPGRTTYVIDKDGVVRMAFSSMTNGKKHVDKAVAEVNKLKDK